MTSPSWDAEEILATAREVLLREAEAVQGLAQRLDVTFVRAVE